MKRIVLFMTAMFLIGTTAQANEQKQLNYQNRVTQSVNKIDSRYGRRAPVVFVENNITFLVYPNGEIDFRTLRRRAYNQVDWNTNNYCAPGYSRSDNRDRGVAKNYDYYGRLRRVGRNYISYNRFDQVRKIGSVYIQYNRRGLVSRIGGLSIYYGKHGRIRDIVGDVHYRGCGFCGIDGCDTSHDSYYNFNDQRNHDDDNRDYYYKNRKRKNHHHYKKQDD